MPLPASLPALRVAGIDEAGRGCLAGPVYAAAVILAPDAPLPGLNDSKKLGAAARERLDGLIRERALAWAVGSADAAEIDRLNIEKASWLAMRRALDGLPLRPDQCWVDGNRAPDFGLPTRTIVGGDALEPCIMAASILAKVARDRELHRLDAEHPGYGLARHKGYGTRVHVEALQRLGPSAIHRLSFRPCRSGMSPDASLPTPPAA